MIQRVSGVVMGGLLLAAAAVACVPESDSGGAGEVIDPRPVSVRLEELPVGFVTREGRFTSGRQYLVTYQLAEQRSQADSGELSGLSVDVTSNADLQAAKDQITIFKDEDAAELLVTRFVEGLAGSARDVVVETVEFPIDGADEVVAYKAEFEDSRGEWAVYSVRFRVLNMTASIQSITERDADGEILPEAKKTTTAIAEVQARKMKDAQD